jgi:hypothetical protein
MGNPLQNGDLMGKSLANGGLSIAMFDYQRVDRHVPMIFLFFHIFSLLFSH